MANNDYKEYNNYSQRDKESMRTAADDKLVEQTDDVESKLTSIDTSATAIKADVGTIKTDTSSIKNNTDRVEEYLEDILATVKKLSVKMIPESLTMAPGDSTKVYISGIDAYSSSVYVNIDGPWSYSEISTQYSSSGYIQVSVDNSAQAGSGVIVVEVSDYSAGSDRTNYLIPITVEAAQ